MIIDSLTDKSAIDIDKLAIPDVKTESFPTFDPRTELEENSWEGARGALYFFRNQALNPELVRTGTRLRHIESFGDLARQLKYFFPEKAGELPLDGQIFNAFKDNVNHVNIGGSESLEGLSLKIAASARYLFPNRALGIERGKDSEFGEIMIGSLRRLRNGGSWHNYIAQVVSAKQYFDGGYEAEPLVDREWAEVAHMLELDRLNIGGDVSEILVPFMANIKLVFPERAGDLGLDKKLWQEMRERLELVKKMRVWEKYFALAYYMTILAADEAKITPDGGIEVVMPKPEPEMQEKIPEMPVKRVF